MEDNTNLNTNLNTSIKDLLGKSTVRRRKAAIGIRKNGCVLYCNALTKALLIESESGSWQTKVELIKTIGQAKCSETVEVLESIIFSNVPEYDMVKSEAAKSWVRITRKGINDAFPILRILKECNYSAIEGALEVLGYDRMIPSEKDQESIIKTCLNFGLSRPIGFTDPRYGLAAACAGWTAEITKGFLDSCLQSHDVPLKYVANHSLDGKYVKLR